MFLPDIQCFIDILTLTPMKANALLSKSVQRLTRQVAVVVFFLAGNLLHGANYPTPEPADYVLHDFHFESGEALPELRMHYQTLGAPRRDGAGRVSNAVLILHGTTGSGR